MTAQCAERDNLVRELCEALNAILGEFNVVSCPNGWYRADVHQDEIGRARNALARAEIVARFAADV
jgi:hypothetical protein